MTKKQLAVAAAKDALAMLDSRVITPDVHSYFKFYHFTSDRSSVWNGDVKSTFKTHTSKKHPCTVCAIGGLLLALTLDKNKLAYKDLRTPGYSDKGQKMLLEALTPYQIALIEGAFEGGFNNEGRIARKLESTPVKEISQKEEEACVRFYRRYTTERRRFRAIMNNIIDNDGVFTLPSLTEAHG